MSAMPDNSRTMVVAVEHGAEWRCNLRPQAGVDLLLVIQVIDEEPLVFARRFLDRLVRLLDNGGDVASAALAVSPTFDLRHLEARCVMARAILRTFRSGAQSQLLLLEPNGATPDCQSHLTALVEGLREGAATDSQIRIGRDLLDLSSGTGTGTRRHRRSSTTSPVTLQNVPATAAPARPPSTGWTLRESSVPLPTLP